MTISTRVQEQLFEMKAAAAAQAALAAGNQCDADALTLIRLAPTSSKEGGVIVATSSTSKVVRTWTRAEHERFLAGLELYPHGPWKQIADHVGTKTTRQTMAHAQKYRQKIARRRQQLAIQQQQQEQLQQLQHLRHPQQPVGMPSNQQLAHAANTNTNVVPIKAEAMSDDVGDDIDDDDDDDDQSTTSEESAAAVVEARMAEALCDGGGDEFFMTEILPLLQQLDNAPTAGLGALGVGFLPFANCDDDDDIVMANAFDMPSPVPHFPPTSTFF